MFTKYFAIITVLSLQLLKAVVFSQYDPNKLQIGSFCKFNGNKTEGVCRDCRNCLGAFRDYKERNIQPTICGYGPDKSAIVCCGSKRRYEAYCEYHYGDPDTAELCPGRYSQLYCTWDPIFPPPPVPSGGVRAGVVPHMVALGWRYDGATVYKCGGVLISKSFALTAAHCMKWIGLKPNILRVGAEHLLKEVKWEMWEIFPILEIIIHPEYVPPAYYNDIALIRTAVRFLYDPTYACLPPEHLIYDEDITYNSSQWGQMEALGYGSISFGGPTDDMHLVKVDIDLLPDQMCNNSFAYNDNQPLGFLKGTQICAGDAKKGIRDTCQGDSGGPLQRLFKKTHTSNNIYYVYGITSFGISCGTGDPGGYTRVASYLDWIESIVWPSAISEEGIPLEEHFSCDETQRCLTKMHRCCRGNERITFACEECIRLGDSYSPGKSRLVPVNSTSG